ncbi:MAG: PilN domain-containing protein [Zoogloeaceae bacterium]|jgi:hypothetical protein|nr:PilN domain-containing protein [Zoogloeaceae bacterium]
MSQQINLFNPSLIPKKEFLSLTNVTLSAGALAVLVGLAGMYFSHQERIALDRLHEYESAVKKMNEDLTELAKRQASRVANPVLEKELARKKEQRDERAQILSLLRNENPASSAEGGVGFSGLFDALARQAPANLWLTGLEIETESSAIILKGGSASEQPLPIFIERLNQEKELKGRRFSALSVEFVSPKPAPEKKDARDERTALEKNGYLAFSLIGEKTPKPASAVSEKTAGDSASAERRAEKPEENQVDPGAPAARISAKTNGAAFAIGGGEVSGGAQKALSALGKEASSTPPARKTADEDTP